MCVIICAEDGKYPTLETLKSAESLNSHGGSIAWLNKNGTRSYHKGIKAKKIYSIIQKTLKPKGITTAIIHFRIASVGDVQKELCHPFQVKDNSPLDLKGENLKCDLLFHNGTWSDYAETIIEYCEKSKKPVKLPTGAYSDSRVMAILASRMGSVGKLAKVVTGWNKLAILTSKGIKKYGSGWINHEGNACSNDYFIPKSFNDFEQSIGGGYFSATNRRGGIQYKSETEVNDDLDAELEGMTAEEKALFYDIKRDYAFSNEEILDYLSYGYSIYDVEYFAENEARHLKNQMTEGQDELDEQTKLFFDLNKG